MSAIANDRYLIAIGQRIEPKIFGTQAEAESAAETLAYHTHHEAGIYRLSDAGRVAVWRQAPEPDNRGFRFDLSTCFDTSFRPDGSSWLDTPAEGK